MTSDVLCPSCKTRLTMKDDQAGDTVECPKCNEAMQLPEPLPVVPPAPPPRPRVRDEDDIPRGRAKVCLECGKKIRSLAEICPKCGVRQYDEPDDRPASRRQSRDGVKVLLVVSAISNIVVGILWASTCFGVILTVPMIVLSVLELMLWSKADSVPKRSLGRQAFNMSIFEILLGIANTPTLICGIILMINSNKLKE